MKHDELYCRHQAYNRRLLRAWFGGCLLGLVVALVVAWAIPVPLGAGPSTLFGAVFAMTGGTLLVARVEP